MIYMKSKFFLFVGLFLSLIVLVFTRDIKQTSLLFLYFSFFSLLILLINTIRSKIINISLKSIFVEGTVDDVSTIAIPTLITKANPSLKSTSKKYENQWYNYITLLSEENTKYNILVSFNNKDYNYFDTSNKTYSYNDDQYTKGQLFSENVYQYNSDLYMIEKLKNQIYRL